MKKYHVLFRGNVYSYDFYAKSQRALRKRILEFLGTDRVPYGTQIWE